MASGGGHDREKVDFGQEYSQDLGPREVSHELNSRMKRKKNRAVHAAGHSAHCIEKAAERFEKN